MLRRKSARRHRRVVAAALSSKYRSTIFAKLELNSKITIFFQGGSGSVVHFWIHAGNAQLAWNFIFKKKTFVTFGT
jgi:hypothetical protein